MNETYLNEQYQLYLLNCHTQGDIWWETHKPYSYQDWIEKSCPNNGGYVRKNKKVNM